MTKGLKEGEPNGRDVYSDIIDHPHHQSPDRPHMSLYERAAQFSPFAALTGYEDMVVEEARLTDIKRELSDDDKELLSQKINLISDVTEDDIHPIVTITYFIPDSKKAGGKYATVTDRVKKVDAVERTLVLMETSGFAKINEKIDIDRIVAISGELVDYLD